MTELRLYCKRCGAFHTTSDQARCTSTPFTLPPDRQEDRSRQDLLNGRYRLIGHTGSRSAGTVYWGKDTHSDQEVVAIKQINLTNLSLQRITETTAIFTTEMIRFRKLQHPNLPRILDHFIDLDLDGYASGSRYLYVVMDYIDGTSLENYLATAPGGLAQSGTRPLPAAEVLTIGLQLCSLLAYFHKQQPAITVSYLHPSTLLRTLQGRLFFIGLTRTQRLRPLRDRNTKQASIRGYIAPECRETVAADIYTLGALLHQLSTGYDPSETPWTFAPLRTMNNPALAALDALLQRMVHSDEAQRPPDISSVEAALRQIQQQYAAERYCQHTEEVISPIEAAMDAPLLMPMRKSWANIEGKQ